MPSSLEELLVEEGFKGRKSITRSRASFGSDNVTTPLYGSHDRHNSDSSSSNRLKTQRTRSDAYRYSSLGRLGGSDSIGDWRSRDNLITRERINGKSTELLKGKHSVERIQDRRLEVNSNALYGHEIVEVGVQKGESIKDVYLNQVNGPLWMEEYPNVIDGRNESMRKGTKSDRKQHSSSKKHLLGDSSSPDNGGTGTKQPGTLDGRTRRGLWNSKSFQDIRIEKHADSIFSDSLPALDEVAIRATISILTGYITPFLKDEEFRLGLRDKCFSSLNFIASEVYQDTESKVFFNLEKAIETVERAAEDDTSTKDLKRASLQLTVITGLNTGKLKYGLTCRIPNYKLSACAHLYLSVIYKLQKKDRVSAKHILQVFADSPLQGRTHLLPELWENFFYPHLSHLSLWHSQEVDSLVDTHSRTRKLKLLNKVFNEYLDSGTYQFAVYYKDWLTEGSEAPPFPSINIPSVSIQTVQLSDSPIHSGELSHQVSTSYSQPMVSKKLCEAVFGRSSKPGAEDDEEGENYHSCMESSSSSNFDIKHMSTYSCESVKHMDQHSISNSTKNLGDVEFLEGEPLSAANKERGLLKADISLQKDNTDEGSDYSSQQQIDAKAEIRYSPQTDNFQVIGANSPLQVSYGDSRRSDEGSSSIPHYLICPLTGQLFEDPVTLETGETFERAAIRKWFDKGNKTCPVTGNSLKCLALPLTNTVVKCVTGSWRSKHCRNILSFASQITKEKGRRELLLLHDRCESIMEQLFTVCSEEERIVNVKHLVSLGGVLYLIQRFEFGTMKEKMHVVALLLCCIEVDAGCRDQIAKGINVKCLLELLQSKHIEARTNVVTLLTELVCLNRRKDVTSILSGLPNEELVNVMHVLLLYHRSSQCEERPLVAVLLLHLDLLVGPQKYSIYREEAVDAITVALNLSLIDENVKARCCKALSILGGCFSLSEKLTENWILKQGAELNVSCKENFESNKEHHRCQDDGALLGVEDLAHIEWLRYLLTSLFGNEKKLFSEAICKCLASRESNLVHICLTTVAWLSLVLSSLSDVGFQISVFSTLFCQLKENLEDGEELEHKILASFSLLNFSKIPECRVLLMAVAEEITTPLRSIADATWTAKQLNSIISNEDLQCDREGKLFTAET